MKVKIQNGELSIDFEGSAKDWRIVREGLHMSITAEKKK
jgi:hypothetical protein